MDDYVVGKNRLEYINTANAYSPFIQYLTGLTFILSSPIALAHIPFFTLILPNGVYKL